MYSLQSVLFVDSYKAISTTCTIGNICLFIYSWSRLTLTCNIFGIQRNFFGITRCIRGNGRACFGTGCRIVRFMIRIFSSRFLNPATWLANRIFHELFLALLFVFLVSYILWLFKCLFTWRFFFSGTCVVFVFAVYSLSTRWWLFDFFTRKSRTGFLGLERKIKANKAYKISIKSARYFRLSII